MIIVGKEEIKWREGLNVATLLEIIEDTHAYAVVRLNGKLISRPHFKDTLVPDDSEVILIPMIAGG